MYHAMRKKQNKHIFQSTTQFPSQVILLMITVSKKWYYFALKNLSRLIRGITSKSDSNCCLHSFTSANEPNSPEDVC